MRSTIPLLVPAVLALSACAPDGSASSALPGELAPDGGLPGDAALALTGEELTSSGWWQTIAMPNAYAYPATSLRTTPTYRLAYPGGTTRWYWEETCGTWRSPQQRLVSERRTGVRGFEVLGRFTRSGSGREPGNQLAAYFHVERCYGGNAEYGLVVPLTDGRMRLYQCHNCNRADQLWTETIVWDSPGARRYYDVIVEPDGDFVFKSIDPATWATTTRHVPRASWMPNLHGAAGYITLTAQQRTTESLVGSVLVVDAVKIRR